MTSDVHYRGYRFSVLPDVWVMHMPHEKSHAKVAHESGGALKRSQQARQRQRRSMYEVNGNLYSQAKVAMRAHTFHAALDEPLLNAFRRVPWLKEPRHARLLSK